MRKAGPEYWDTLLKMSDFEQTKENVETAREILPELIRNTIEQLRTVYKSIPSGLAESASNFFILACNAKLQNIKEQANSYWAEKMLNDSSLRFFLKIQDQHFDITQKVHSDLARHDLITLDQKQKQNFKSTTPELQDVSTDLEWVLYKV
jgi:hypothetical protein